MLYSSFEAPRTEQKLGCRFGMELKLPISSFFSSLFCDNEYFLHFKLETYVYNAMLCLSVSSLFSVDCVMILLSGKWKMCVENEKEKRVDWIHCGTVLSRFSDLINDAKNESVYCCCSCCSNPFYLLISISYRCHHSNVIFFIAAGRRRKERK